MTKEKGLAELPPPARGLGRFAALVDQDVIGDGVVVDVTNLDVVLVPANRETRRSQQEKGVATHGMHGVLAVGSPGRVARAQLDVVGVRRRTGNTRVTPGSSGFTRVHRAQACADVGPAVGIAGRNGERQVIAPGVAAGVYGGDDVHGPVTALGAVRLGVGNPHGVRIARLQGDVVRRHGALTIRGQVHQGVESPALVGRDGLDLGSVDVRCRRRVGILAAGHGQGEQSDR
ncbi:hypothetical protein C0580_01885 [Candidatus Parcubacteria bacterium]|nr:MAG: hypothetical protein C0580_01885 [Candidatus Parcubacteria bacterium]